jgi:hypothetical protein
LNARDTATGGPLESEDDVLTRLRDDRHHGGSLNGYMGMRHGWDGLHLLEDVSEPAEHAEDLSVETLAQDFEAQQQPLSLRQRFRLIFGTLDDAPLKVA